MPNAETVTSRIVCLRKEILSLTGKHQENGSNINRSVFDPELCMTETGQSGAEAA
jgi:hypothetical protein